MSVSRSAAAIRESVTPVDLSLSSYGDQSHTPRPSVLQHVSEVAIAMSPTLPVGNVLS